MGKLIDGKALALQKVEQVRRSVEALQTDDITPGLAVILVGNDPASAIYVRNKTRACAQAGIANLQHDLPATTSEAALLQLVATLNADPQVHGILVQQPLPAHINAQRVLEAIAPEKDADGFHPTNMGRLALGLPGPRPCTPLGVMQMLAHIGYDPAGREAVVLGRSAIVGKPMGLMLLAAHATVTWCHSRTADLPSHVRRADLLVAAIGKPHFVHADWVKPGAVVIDVGINRTPEGRIVGDVEPAVAGFASHCSPVPGGVGPMTIAMLLQNTVWLAAQSARRNEPK
ncbi:MAG: bifunctional methylenetetrahydrofolate dehydrogenase/methenyltetrahydrofolate cyclohydrolase FolD [Deltaproteobacteria bacterium]|nr:bifunctional methylenetetrahydrofolate dehydrogenase/methenyltetrahydrofolate cyclohydrolase FolD [Deltaproteobacteria bacterium]